MRNKDKQLLIELNDGNITSDTFINSFSLDLRIATDFVKEEIKTVIDTKDPGEIQLALPLIWLSDDISKFVDELNELLINPNHRSHQQIAKELQNIASPTTVPYVRKALETNFDYLEYTCSQSSVIAKWFSWLLYSIRTAEAIGLMREYSHSSDEGIKNEMLYRLNKVQC